MNVLIADPDDPYMEKILGKIPNDEKERIIKFEQATERFIGALNVRESLRRELQEYNEAREERIRIEAECARAEAQILEYRKEMSDVVNNYLMEKMMAFQEGLAIMDEALINNDSNAYIAGADVIQKSLGYENSFSNQAEFDSLMDSEDDFTL